MDDFREISSEHALRYSPPNDIRAFNENLFNVPEIERAVMALMAIKDAPEHHMCPKFNFYHEVSRFGNPPVRYQPLIDERIIREYESVKDDKIRVCFDNLNFTINASDEFSTRWWAPINDYFVETLRDSDLPGGLRTKYYYYTGGTCATSPAFRNNEKLGQATAYFFGDELSALSCFVNNHLDIKATYEKNGYIQENFGIWDGTLSDFLKTASLVSGALSGIPRAPVGWHRCTPVPYNAYGEIKLSHPEYGLIVMRGNEYKVGPSGQVPLSCNKDNEIYTIPATLLFGIEALGLLKKERSANG